MEDGSLRALRMGASPGSPSPAKLRRMTTLRALAAGLLLGLPAATSAAQGTPPRDSAVTPAPIVMRRDLAVLGVGAGLAFLAQRADLAVRDELRRDRYQDSGTLDALESVGDLWGGGASLGAGLALWLGGLKTRNATVAASGFRALEAIMVSGQVTGLLKGAVGRARPRVDSTDAWNVEWWRGFREPNGDYKSMPSGHATAAFAFAAAVTSEVAHRSPGHARLVGITTYGLAGVTAWSRMHSNAHWLSDVTMGAAIGVASGWAVARWHQTRPQNKVDDLFLGPVLSPFVSGAPGGRTLVGASIAWR